MQAKMSQWILIIDKLFIELIKMSEFRQGKYRSITVIESVTAFVHSESPNAEDFMNRYFFVT